MQAEKLGTSWWGRMDRDTGGPLPSLASLTDMLGCVLTPQDDHLTLPCLVPREVRVHTLAAAQISFVSMPKRGLGERGVTV